MSVQKSKPPVLVIIGVGRTSSKVTIQTCRGEFKLATRTCSTDITLYYCFTHSIRSSSLGRLPKFWINAFFKRLRRFGYINCVITIDDLIDRTDYELFKKVCSASHLPFTFTICSRRIGQVTFVSEVILFCCLIIILICIKILHCSISVSIYQIKLPYYLLVLLVMFLLKITYLLITYFLS